MDKKNVVEKKIHEEKAHKIVTRLAVETIDTEVLISIIKYIEPYHYEEIVEERFLSKICGYPICEKVLKKVPSQKYQISSKLNKVYDLGDRKRYCSAQCYKSSKYLETQVSSVPIWLRNTPEYLKNDGVKSITLLNSSSNSVIQPKEYHDEYDMKFKVTDSTVNTKVASKLNSEFTQINDQVISRDQLLGHQIEMELNSIENQWRTKYHVEKTNVETKMKDPLAKNNIFKHKNVNETRASSRNEAADVKRDALENITEQTLTENISNKKFIESTLIHSKPTSLFHLGKIFEITNSSELKANQLSVDENDEDALSKYFFTEYIINRISNLLSDRTKEYILEKKSIEKSAIHEERKRLDHLKMFDEYVTETGVLFDNLTHEVSSEAVGKTIDETDNRMAPSSKNLNLLKDLNDNGEAEMIAKLELMGMNPHEPSEDNLPSLPINESTDAECIKDTGMKPVPNFKELKIEAEQQQLRIKEFFIGDPSSQKAEKLKELEARRAEELEMAKDETAFSSNSFKLKSEEQDIVRVLPTVDSQSQMGIRRKIFFEKLVKYMDQLLKFSDYSTGDVQLTNHIKNFVFSLKLDNQNILFNTSEWPIVSLFILKILSLKHTSKYKEATDYDTLSTALEKLIRSNKLIETILTSFKLDQERFDKICNYLVV